MARTFTVEVRDLGGGINAEDRPDEINANENLSSLRNARVEGRSKKPRPGYVTIADLLTGGTRVRGLYGFDRDAAANDRLISVYNLGIRTFLPGTDTAWSAPIATTLTSDTKIRFSKYKDWLFLFNGVDEPGRFTGAAYSEPFVKPDSIALAANFLPAFGEVINNSLYVGGVPSSPNTFFISKPGSSASPQDVYDFSGALGAGNADEVLAPSRGTGVKQMSDYAVLFTINSAAVVKGFKDLGEKIVPDIAPVPGADGLVNQDAAVVIDNDIYYLTPRKEIKSLSRDFADGVSTRVNSPSKKINPILQTLLDDDQSDAFGYYYQTKKLMKMWVRSVGSSFPDLCLIADFQKVDENKNPRWFFDDGKAMNAAVYFKNKAYMASAILGQVYEDEVGFADDDNVPIRTTWETKEFNANNPATLKRFNNINIYGQITTTTSIIATVYVDGVQAAQVTIDSNDITSSELGGVGVDGIAEEAIGDDSISSAVEDLRDFVKRIPFRFTGKKLKIKFETFDVNQNYRISYLDYSFISMGKLYHPVSEVL